MRYRILGTLLLLSAITLRAADGRESVTQLSMRTALADNCVNDVLSDSRNLMWIGTAAGLDLYDGIHLTHVPFLDATDALQPIVHILAEDPSGILWAGTSDGLYRRNGNRLEMCRFLCKELDGVSVRHMCCGKDGFLWIAVIGHRILRIGTSDSEIETLPLSVTAICCAPGGGIYAADGEGRIFFWEGGGTDPVPLPEKQFAVLSGKRISRMVCIGSRIFLAMEDGSAFCIDREDQVCSSLPLIKRMRGVIGRSEEKEFWIAARGGVHVLDSTLAEIRTLLPFNDNSFRCLAQGRNGTVLAGTLLEGAALIAPNQTRLRHYSDANDGSSYKVRDFAETPDGRIWIGSDTRGLLCLDPRDPDAQPSRSYFPRKNITGLMAEGNKLWIGALDNEMSVTLLDTDSGKTTAFPDAGKNVYTFARDRKGRLWIGSKDGFCMGQDHADGTFARELFIPCTQVCRIICVQDGSIWVATTGGQVFHCKESGINTYKIPKFNFLTDIAEDSTGHIFATSEGGGLWEFDPERDCFMALSDIETRLLKISSWGDLLWITGAKGIHILNPGDRKQLPLIPVKALGIDGFNYSSNFIASDGTLYAGTSDGFIAFSVQRLSEQTPSLEAPVISSLHILSSSHRQADDCFICPSSVNLGRKAHSFEVNVSPLDYAPLPDKQLFWKIDGLNEWTPVRDGSFPVYDLPVGKYRLRIKSISLSGKGSPETIMYLRAQPSLMLSPGAFISYFIIFLLSVIFIAVYFSRSARQRAEHEHERQMLASKMEFLTAIAHEIRTPLSLLQIPLEFLIQKYSSSADGSVQENLEIMRRNSLKLTVLINELLDFRKLSDSSFRIHPETMDIRSIIRDAHRRFLSSFLQDGKTLSISTPDTLVSCETDVRLLGRILDNLFSNALKYSAHHTAVILSVFGNDAVISVESDGEPLPEDVRELIFKPFYRYGKDTSANVEGTGLGLSTSRQFATLLGGSLKMDEDLNVNRFILRIPVSVEDISPVGLPVVEVKDKSVMVVEDDKDMARVIGDVLGDAYNVTYASSGRSALDMIASGASPSLIVSDIIMPGMDGIALTKSLKGDLSTSHIPVILLSAEIPDVYMQESIDEGADAYLEKPFSPKKLHSTVDNLIENRRRIYDFYVASLPTGNALPSGRVSTMEQKFLRTITEYVSAHLDRDITLDDLAEVVCMSSSTLYKKMKAYADISPMEFVMKMRIQKAVELLKDDSFSVQDVAVAVGFNTHSFFSECFKREFGITPRQWRARNVPKTSK